ncbi:MAG: hypothetical protein ACTSRP_21370 [Candidatus Helarchaeota archaeon]
MGKIKKKKIGLLEKILGYIGKKLMYRQQRKISKLLVNLANRELVRLLYEIDGNLETALRILYDLSTHAGHDFLMEWVEKGSVIFSKNLADHAFWIKSGYYSFTGDNIKFIKYIPPEKEGDPHKIVWRIYECFVCAGMDHDNSFEIKKEDFGEHGYGGVTAGIFQTTTNMINEYVGIEFECRVRETKCILKGDPYGEFVAEYYPKKSTESKNE